MNTVCLAGNGYLRKIFGDTVLAWLEVVLIALVIWFVVYPLLKYLFCRFTTWRICRFSINNAKNCKDAWMTVGRGFAWPFIPSWGVKKPDFVLYSKGVVYIVKQHSFYNKRKKIIFISPEGWCFTRQKKNRKTEKLLTIKSIDSDFKQIKTKPAPFYMIRYAQALAKELNAPVVPVMLHAPGVKYLNTRHGVIMNNGDYTFYGMVVTDNATLKKTVLPKDENTALPILTFPERKSAAAKIKKVITSDLR